jgi:hypothetical protein
MATAVPATEPTMSRTKPVIAEEAVALVERRRRQARAHYARMRDDARRYREAQQTG